MSGRAVPEASEVADDLRALRKRDAASLRRVRRRISRQLQGHDAEVVLDLALELLGSGAPGAHVVAYEVILHHPLALPSLTWADIERLGSTIGSWGEVDTFACCIAGRAWRMGRISDRRIAKWARSSDRWWRRAALVSTVPLNVRAQGGQGDSTRTLAVCSQLLHDRDPMVVKALSWALRALAVRDPDSVRAFLQAHGVELAPRVVREVSSKLDTGRKNPRRRVGQTT